MIDAGARYGDRDELSNKLLYKRITKWSADKLVLDDGTIVTLEMSENDCCAFAGGSFSDVTLDAVITGIVIGDPISIPDSDTTVNQVHLKIFHNQNTIAQAQMTADAGNGNYYYSVGSVVVDKVHYPIVRA